MRRLIILLICLMIFLTACGNDETIDEHGRKEIILALFLSDDALKTSIKAQVKAYNYENSHYYIRVDDYYSLAFSTGDFVYNEYLARYNDAAQQLDLNIVSKNNKRQPDIIISNSDIYHKYAEKGVLTDLNEFYQRDIDQAAIYGNVIEALKIKYKLFGITTSFAVSAIFMDSATASLDLSIEALIELQKELGYSLVGQSERKYIFNQWLYFYISELVDWETGSCDFNNPNFIAILEMVKGLPEKMESDSKTAIQEKRPFLTSNIFYSIHDYQAFSNLFAGDMVCFGYPWQEDEFAINVTEVFAIATYSSHKEEAWKFISSFLADDYQMKQAPKNPPQEIRGIPISRNALEYKIEKNLKTEDGRVNSNSLRWAWVLYENVEVPYVETKAMDDFRHILEQDMRMDVRDDTMMMIIHEEIEAYFAGQISVEQVIDYLNNRIQLYLDEVSN